MEIEDTVQGKITNRCRIGKITEIYGQLDAYHKIQFENSAFRTLLEIQNMKMGLQIIHELIRRSESPEGKNEVWFSFGEQRARFGLGEFTLVTGLKPTEPEMEDGQIEGVDEELALKSEIVSMYFQNSKGKITKSELFRAFKRTRDHSHKFKMGLLLILAYVLLAPEEETHLDLWWFHLVEDVDRFNRFPWGKLSYEYTIKIFKANMAETMKNYEKSNRIPYNIHGFPLAIMIWAFEAIPSFGMKYGIKQNEESIPRMHRWNFTKQNLPGLEVSTFFELQIRVLKNEVKRTLQPSHVEADIYLPAGMDNLWEEEVEKTEEDAPSPSAQDQPRDQPAPPAFQQHHDQPYQQHHDQPSTSNYSDLAEMVRLEIGGFATRILDVVTKRCDQLDGRCDRIESKLDTLLKSAERGGFSSRRSWPQSEMKGFDNYAHSRDGVREEGKGEREESHGKPVDPKEDDAEEQKNEREHVTPTEDDQQQNGNDGVGEHVTPTKDDQQQNENDRANVSNPGSALVTYKRRFNSKTSHSKTHSEESCSKGKVEDVVTIEDSPDIPSLKGRGMRKKRLAPTLLPPFTNPRKRRKLKNVTKYNPFRQVDPVKESDLANWMMKATPSCKVALKICDAGKEFFTKLMSEEGWLSDDHVNSAMFHIRERAAKYKKLFQQECAILDSHFVYFVSKAYSELFELGKTKSEFKFEKAMVRYVNGECPPENGKPWKECTHLYIPYCVPGDHWFALHVDLHTRQINVYDSMKKRIYAATLGNLMKPFQIVLPLLLNHHVDDKFKTSQFDWKRVTCPQQDNGGDCGVFTIKFIEFMQAGLDINLISHSNMSSWRKKLAAEIYWQDFDP